MPTVTGQVFVAYPNNPIQILSFFFVKLQLSVPFSNSFFKSKLHRGFKKNSIYLLRKISNSTLSK